MCCHKELFSDFEEITSLKTVSGISGGASRVKGRGTVVLNVHGGKLTLKDAEFVPSAKVNLISVSKLAREGIKASFGEYSCTLHSPECEFTGYLRYGQYWLAMRSRSEFCHAEDVVSHSEK